MDKATNEALKCLAEIVRDYRTWTEGQYYDGEIVGSLERFDEVRADWRADITDCADDLVQAAGLI